MIGAGLLVLVALIGGLVFWVRRARPGAEPAAPASEPRSHRVPLVTEAFVYLGAILLLAGGGTAIGQRWDDLGQSSRLAILAGATLVSLLVGAFARRSKEPAFRRLASVAWVLSVAGMAGTVGVTADWNDLSDHSSVLAVTGAMTMYGAVLWFFLRAPLQHVVTFGALLFAVANVYGRFWVGCPEWVVPVTLWATGAAWAGLGWARRIPPGWLAVPAGLLVVLITPTGIQYAPTRYALGIGTAAAVMTLSVIGRFVPGLALGSIAMLGYVVGVMTTYFADSLGVPAALALGGVALLVVAAVVTRFLPRLRTTPPPVPTPVEAEPAEPKGRVGAGRHSTRS